MPASSEARLEQSPAADPILYVGMYSVRASAGIYSYRLDPLSGNLTPLAITAAAANPSNLVADSQRNLLYVASETGSHDERTSGSIAAYRFHRSTGELHRLNCVDSGGAGPCYLSLDEEVRYLMAANFHGGTIAVLPINEDGTLLPPSLVADCARLLGAPPPAVSHPHFIHLAPGRRFVVVADLGLDRLLLFPTQDAVSPLAARPTVLTLPPRSGPRFGCFHPRGLCFYLLNELSSQIVVYSLTPQPPHTSAFAPLQHLSTLPASFSGENFAAELHIDTAGEFLYASNRGHDSIAVFRTHPDRGTLTFVGCTPSAGKTPRSFALHLGGNYLVVGNQESNTLAVFSITHRDSGPSLSLASTCAMPSPSCVAFV